MKVLKILERNKNSYHRIYNFWQRSEKRKPIKFVRQNNLNLYVWLTWWFK